LIPDAAALRDALISKGTRLIAIDGRGGSGKSTLARQLAAGWPQALVIELDDFYRPLAERHEPPASHGADLDLERLVEQVLDPFHSGRAGRYQRYDWEEDRLTTWRDVPADAVILLEGVYSTSQRLRGFLDYSIWVDCPHDVRLRRGVERDGERMRAVWVEQWMPAEDRYVEAERPRATADLVLDGSGHDKLERHPSLDDRFDPAVSIVGHDSRWARQAQDELRRLAETLGSAAVRLEHVGSTAVPALAGKPILDLQLSVAGIARRDLYVKPLQGLGYTFIPDPGSPDFHFFAKPLVRPRSHHLHVCEAGSEHELRHIAVRDFLRAHGAEARSYETLKRDLLERFPNDRLEYIAGKERYLDQLQERALEWARRA
jgi:uridine kinase